MSERTHRYTSHVEWTGNTGRGTADYRAYRRDFLLRDGPKPDIPGSSHPEWRGDGTRYNPDDLLVAALASCHMLWYLHLCADSGIVVTEYTDDAEGTLELAPDGGGRFTSVTLHPRVRIAAGDPARATELHRLAHEKCFVANSVNFPVHHVPVTLTGGRVAEGPPAPTAK
jgi:organic hydroperoxide reductase OsmC/OhrA